MNKMHEEMKKKIEADSTQEGNTYAEHTSQA